MRLDLPKKVGLSGGRFREGEADEVIVDIDIDVVRLEVTSLAATRGPDRAADLRNGRCSFVAMVAGSPPSSGSHERVAQPHASRSPREGARTAAASRVLSRLAAQDWLVLVYLLVQLAAVTMGAGPRRSAAIVMLFGDLAFFVGCMAVARSDLTARNRVVSAAFYRVGIIGSMLGSFLQLHYIVPTASSGLRDAQIYRLDQVLFGFEPALLMDRFVAPSTTEWFSFFYYSYFFILTLYLIPAALFERRGRVISELSGGFLFVMCVGHCLYMLVPGRGPYMFLAHLFDHPLAGPTWWPTVMRTVDAVDGASRKDVFPSLHTAIPTFFTLFAFRNRAHRPYRWAWPITGFFTTQIILATMFLRWHYLIDVIAGLCLATTAFAISIRVVRIERQARLKLRSGPVWRPLFGRAEP